MAGQLIWDTEDDKKGQLVNGYAVAAMYQCTEAEVKALMKYAKDEAAKTSKKKAPAECRDAARQAEKKLTDAIVSYLKPRLRIHYRDKTTVLYTYFDDKLELFKVGFSPMRSVQLADFVGLLYNRDNAAWTGLRDRIDDAIDEAATEFTEAGRQVPEFMDLLLGAMVDILSLKYPDMVLPEDLPILSWDRDALLRLNPAVLKPGAWPHIREYMRRVSHPEQLMAFIWKCFDPTDFGRQIVWSQSLGHSGQSTFWSVVFGFLDKIAVSISKSSHQDKHTLAECYLKRFAMVSDCGNRHFYSTELVKQLSGNDQSSVRQMYRDAFAARLYCRVVALSNIAPEIDTTSNAMRTRMLYFTVKPFPESEANPDVEKEYKKEFWHFLKACRDVHTKLCRRDSDGKFGPIPMPNDMWELIRVRCDKPVRNMARAFVRQRVVLSEGGEILQSELFKEFKAFYLKHIKMGADGAGILSADKADVFQAFDNLIFDMLGSDGGLIKESKSGLRRYIGVKLIPENESEDADVEVFHAGQPDLPEVEGEDEDEDEEDLIL